METVVEVHNKAMLIKMIKLAQNLNEFKEEIASDPAADQEDW
jgi:hypothetical protein